MFELFPNFYRGIVVVKEITNQKSYKPVRRLLKQAIDEQAELDAASEPRVLAWNEAHKTFGSQPDQYFPSIKSLLQRIKTNHDLPFINSAVALFNYISLKYVLPCGGDDIERVTGNLVLGIADGAERFFPLGGTAEESPVPGEVIYYDDVTKNVMCRRWNWRNGDATKIEVTSKKIVINIDCLPPITPEVGNAARDELAELLKTHCHADLETAFIDATHREYELSMF